MVGTRDGAAEETGGSIRIAGLEELALARDAL
jgi:hypothetical protein